MSAESLKASNLLIYNDRPIAELDKTELIDLIDTLWEVLARALVDLEEMRKGYSSGYRRAAAPR